jgi:hypothetical protein
VEPWFKRSSNEMAPKKKMTVGSEARMEKVVEAISQNKVTAKMRT